MDTVQKLLDITSRIDHLESAAEWIVKETIHSDNGIAQTSTLICVLADEVREQLYTLVKALEEVRDLGQLH